MSPAELHAWCAARVATEVHVSEWLIVTQERINRFAAATDDFQWIHVDPVRAAAESPWRTTIAHGFLTLSLYPMLRAPAGAHEGYPGVRTIINYGLNRVRYPSAVRVGSALRLRATLDAVEAVPGGVQVEESCLFEVGGQDKPACVAQVLVRLYC